MIALAFRLAKRDLRGGLAGFGILLACLALGVAAIAGAGSMNASFRTALAEDARALLGGDAEVVLSYRQPSPDEAALLQGFGTTAGTVEMRAMARGGEGRQTLVEIKGVDGAYPLVGAAVFAPALSVAETLGKGADGWGAAADPNLIERLGLKIGDRVTIGATAFVLRAAIVKEPDRIARPFAFGPRFMVDAAALPETGLVQPGSLIRYSTLVRFDPGHDFAAFKAALDTRFPEAGWQIRGTADAAPSVKRYLDNVSQFLSLVGLTSLLVGGIGVANAVKAFLAARLRSIAKLKCLGASHRLILAVYGIQIAALGAFGILLGLALGAALPNLVILAFGDQLPLDARMGLFGLPLLVAAAFGILVTLLFSALPLARSGLVPASMLFRDIVSPVTAFPGRATLIVMATALALLAGLAVASAPDRVLAAVFLAGAAGAFAIFSGFGWGIERAARWAGANPAEGRGVALSLALSSLHRPGSATRAVVLSLGLGLTVLVTVALVQANLSRDFSERIPAEAPTFFFIDIQPGQKDAFEAAVTQAGGRVAALAPMIRGRIVRIDGRPVEEVAIDPAARWAVQGDRGLSTAATPPDGTRLVAGQWWGEAYGGPPLVSLDAAIAKGFHIGVGQTITVNVLGREITATIASLREIDWMSMSMNFTFLLTPNALAGAPFSDIATVFAPKGADAAVERAVTTALPNVSSIAIREALDAARAVVSKAALAITGAALVTLAAGVLVLAGAIAAGRRRRVEEAVLMKVLGARRRDLLAALSIEFALLGAATGLVAALLGSIAAWAVLTFVLRAEWSFLPVPLAATVLAAMAFVAAMGLWGARRALVVRAAPYLRHA